MSIMKIAFDAGGRATTNIGGVDVVIAPDPMINGSGKGNEFNDQTYDYLVLTADELGGGPDDENQSLIHGVRLFPTLFILLYPSSSALSTPTSSVSRASLPLTITLARCTPVTVTRASLMALG